MYYFKKYLIFLLPILLSYCTQKTISYNYHIIDEPPVMEEQPAEVPEEPKDIFSNFSLDSIQVYVKVILDSINGNDLYQINGEYIFSKNVLPEIYKKTGYGLNWFDSNNRLEAMECINNSWTDGLNPDDYHIKELLSLRENILNNTFLDYKGIAQFDVLLTDGLLIYSNHLIKGKLNPNTLDVNWNLLAKDIPENPVKIFLNAIKENSITETIYNFRPQYAPYSQFVNEMIRYQLIKDNGGWEKVSVNNVIKPGEISDELGAIRKRLFVTGDIEFEESINDASYNEELVAAIKKFQDRHGLNPDGVIGKKTIAALNIPIDQKLNKIKLNMERARWILHDLSNDMILVNIARFQLYYLQDSVLTHETKVMVGTYYHQTPIFRSKMKYLVFNPTWTVPYSIATKEILPKIKKDPDYLSTRNISLLTRGGKAIPQSSVDWTKVDQSNFAYTLRQEPGPGNALGQVKFIFPNKHAVYLHDTPSKYLFTKEERAFSHGCIRVQNPLKLAEILLNDEDKWNQEKIQDVLNAKKEKTVNLKKPLDVLLLYWTSGFLDNGDIFFLNDIYHRDKKIQQELSDEDWKTLHLN